MLSKLLITTQDAIVDAKKKENVVWHRYFLPGGAFHEKEPQQMDGELVKAEVQQLIQGNDSCYYLGAQPIYTGVNPLDDHPMDAHKRRRIHVKNDELVGWGKRYPPMWQHSEECLLRARNGTQKFPAEVTFHLSACVRRKLFLWQTRKAAARGEKQGWCPTVNWWEQDLEAELDAVISLSGGKKVVIELTEYKRDTDVPGFPTSTGWKFSDKTITLLEKLKNANVKVSLDDVNWINPSHPCTFEFAFKAAKFLHQFKLDIKACAQVYNTLPDMPDAQKFAPLEADESVREQKLNALKAFVGDLRAEHDHIEMVIELSVCSLELASLCPSFNVFAHKWVLVQGGLTNDWAKQI